MAAASILSILPLFVKKRHTRLWEEEEEEGLNSKLHSGVKVKGLLHQETSVMHKIPYIPYGQAHI